MIRIALVLGDITEQDVDAVVTAANASLPGGGGVDGAVHRRGGPAIFEACQELIASTYGPGGLPTGEAVATTAGALPARWVIHTVGPVHGEDEDGVALLAACHRASLRVADELGAGTIAFPAVSTGSHGWPLDEAAAIAIRTVVDAETALTEARFVLFDEDTYAAYAAALAGTAH
ncbi:O-acetyl-ADP-ribose deacetylase [Embleya sp. NPDC050154]|uniref:O-acetyl-ADP-ribose deacetylase n=1 Tax=Embleya sp. NPDC050154 TaxID=3363988 RepID=UPI0037B7C794